jgi:hypothetical protein
MMLSADSLLFLATSHHFGETCQLVRPPNELGQQRSAVGGPLALMLQRANLISEDLIRERSAFPF